MRDPARIDPMLEQLRQYWHAHPDMRLGQIIENARFMGRDLNAGADTFNVEDDMLLDGIRKLAAMSG